MKLSNFLTSKGRTTRFPFLIYSLIYYVIGNLSYELLRGYFLNIPMIAISLILLYLITIQYIKRVHDFDRNGWYLLWLFVPIINFGIIYELLFKRGSISTNEYGSDPLHNMKEIDVIRVSEERIMKLEKFDLKNIDEEKHQSYKDIIQHSNIIHTLHNQEMLAYVGTEDENNRMNIHNLITVLTALSFIILAFILKDWLLILGIPLVILGLWLSSPFGIIKPKFTFWVHLLGLLFFLYENNNTWSVIIGISLFSFSNCLMSRIWLTDIYNRRAYYSKIIFDLLVKTKTIPI